MDRRKRILVFPRLATGAAKGVTMNQRQGNHSSNVPSIGYDPAHAGKSADVYEDFHVRDITNRRSAGDFHSESVALASLQGRPDGHFSINNHQGKWCEVEIRGGDRYVRHNLMVDGSPAAFTNIDEN